VTLPEFNKISTKKVLLRKREKGKRGKREKGKKRKKGGKGET